MNNLLIMSLKPFSDHFSLQRVNAMVLRHLYLMRKSWPRLIELAYWPSVQMILWGFTAQFLAANSSWVAQAPGLLIAAVLLWDILFRSQLGTSLTFFEEIYSRNLGQLFVSPLRAYELASAMLIISFIRTVIGVGVAALLAIPFYGYSIFNIGLPLAAFLINLMMLGWAIGLMVSGLVLKYGLGAEPFAWAAIFALAPVSGIYYPISVLPEWLQIISQFIPASYVFEGLRALLIQHKLETDLLLKAASLNFIYLSAGIGVFLLAFRHARKHGLLLHVGE